MSLTSAASLEGPADPAQTPNLVFSLVLWLKLLMLTTQFLFLLIRSSLLFVASVETERDAFCVCPQKF